MCEEIQILERFASDKGFDFRIFWGEYFMFYEKDGKEFKTRITDDKMIEIMYKDWNTVELDWIEV